MGREKGGKLHSYEKEDTSTRRVCDLKRDKEGNTWEGKTSKMTERKRKQNQDGKQDQKGEGRE